MPGDRLTEADVLAAAAGYDVLGSEEVDGRRLFVVRPIAERPSMTPEETISWWTRQLIEAEQERIRRAIESWEEDDAGSETPVPS